MVCLVPAYEAPREARVHPARHNKTTCSSPFSVDLNASSSSSHLATSNPLYIGFRGLETMPLSTTTTPPDSGMGCERGAGQVGEEEALLPDGKRSLLGSLEQDLGKDPERGGTTSASASETKTRRRC